MCGPISRLLASGSLTSVLPALVHWSVAGSYNSELVPLAVSTSKSFPLGSLQKPSSEKLSALPIPVGVQVKVAALNKTCLLEKISPIVNVSSSSTAPGASPICDQPTGGLTDVHVFGDKIVNGALIRFYTNKEIIFAPFYNHSTVG